MFPNTSASLTFTYCVYRNNPNPGSPFTLSVYSLSFFLTLTQMDLNSTSVMSFTFIFCSILFPNYSPDTLCFFLFLNWKMGWMHQPTTVKMNTTGPDYMCSCFCLWIFFVHLTFKDRLLLYIAMTACFYNPPSLLFLLVLSTGYYSRFLLSASFLFCGALSLWSSVTLTHRCCIWLIFHV